MNSVTVGGGTAQQRARRVAGKVALVTGAARGQGRSHALRLAHEGADIIAVDICEQISTVPYRLASDADLRATVDQVRAAGRRIYAARVDVRDSAALGEAVHKAVTTLGRLDIVSANAGIFSVGAALELTEAAWQDMIDVNLTGVWKTVKAAAPHIVQAGRGGSIIVTSSKNGLVGSPMFAHYVAAKHGAIGLVRALALELADDQIRVNALVPGGVDTDMIRDFDGITTSAVSYVGPHRDRRPDDPITSSLLTPSDISDALLFLASDEAKYITGTVLQVDGHALVRHAPEARP